MKNLIIATVIVGATVAGLLIYLRENYVEREPISDAGDAANDAYKTMNRHIGKAERTFDHVLN